MIEEKRQAKAETKVFESDPHGQGVTADDVSWLIPHQANLRIISAAAEKMSDR